MSGTPRMSVVTPTWNRRGALPGAIESVRAQSVQDYEHLIVDDGSSDGTAGMLAERYGDDPRIRLIRQPHAGVSAARNRAVAQARAPWVGLLDSDDRWEPHCIESHLRNATRHPDADVLVADCRYVGEHGHGWKTAMTRSEWRPPDSLESVCHGGWVVPSALAIRTSALRSEPFDESVRLAEDLDLLIRFLVAGRKVRVSREVVARYHAGEAPGDETRLTADARGMLIAMQEIRQRHAHHCDACRQDPLGLARRRAKWRMEQGRWREARQDLVFWWLRRPGSTTALRGLLRSLLARR
ncbi:MAG: glycosyltransferase [Myxococcota bacterium]